MLLTISHETRTPLNSISLSLELAIGDKTVNEIAKNEFLKPALSSAQLY